MNIELTDTELGMIALALTVSGQLSIGRYPSPQAMEILVTRKVEFFELTKTMANLLPEKKG